MFVYQSKLFRCFISENMDFVRNVNMIVNKITEDKYLLTAITTQYLYNKSSGISIEDSVQRTLDSEWCDIQKDYLFKLIGGKFGQMWQWGH